VVHVPFHIIFVIFRLADSLSPDMQRNNKATERRRSVALLIETSNSYSRELLHGIRGYMRQQRHWAVHLTELGRGDAPPQWLANWRGDGIIARIENQLIEQAVRAARLPVVNVSAARLAPEFPCIISDSRKVAEIAAKHLLERGLEHFGYCGDNHLPWSANHEESFVRHLERQGHAPHIFPSEPEDFADWNRERRKLADWLRSLPKPVGIMACHDIRGQQVLDVCAWLGIQVPEEVAVIGQHNDELLCELCDPPLSSVIPNPRRAGFEAAALLDHLIQGKKSTPLIRTIPPVGVATRQSTDVVALGDTRIAAAVRYIRQNACRGIGVDDVLEAVPMSRTLLERRFRKFLGRAPYEEILHLRLNRAKELLARNSDLTIAEIALECGFSCPEYMSAAFKKQLGTSPRAYRLSHRCPS
jgi:LacI family transcriptional regulator